MIARASAMSVLESEVRTTLHWMIAIGRIYPFAMQSARILETFMAAAGMPEGGGRVGREEIEAALFQRDVADVIEGTNAVE